MKKITCSEKIGIGITAEYNPFHNGHALHIYRARRNFSVDVPVTVALSSSFTQRGEAAVADKWTRTRMALANGVDLVLELPFAFACNAAPEFARGAVEILAATRMVTHLSFGMENPPLKSDHPAAAEKDLSRTQNVTLDIDTILSILIHEPVSFKLSLKKNLDSGQSYPKAVAGALDIELPGSGAFLSQPNNSLALAYLLHIRRKNFELSPLPVQREGSGYHDEGASPLASATAIREALSDGDETWIREAMPSSSLELLRTGRERGRLALSTDRLWDLLRGLLTRSTPDELRKVAGMDEGIENLFLKHYVRATSYEDFIGRCVCARYTRSRLQRQVIRTLVGFDRWTASALARSGPPYIRILGYNERGLQLLQAHKKDPALPLITRLSAAPGPLGRAAADLEFRASRLRELLIPRPDLRFEEKQKPVTLQSEERSSL